MKKTVCTIVEKCAAWVLLDRKMMWVQLHYCTTSYRTKNVVLSPGKCCWFLQFCPESKPGQIGVRKMQCILPLQSFGLKIAKFSNFFKVCKFFIIFPLKLCRGWNEWYIKNRWPRKYLPTNEKKNMKEIYFLEASLILGYLTFILQD